MTSATLHGILIYVNTIYWNYRYSMHGLFNLLTVTYLFSVLRHVKSFQLNYA
jgi:hypothetical protein